MKYMSFVFRIFVVMDAGEKHFDRICAGCAYVKSSMDSGWVKPKCALKDIDTTWDGYCSEWEEPDGYH